MVKYYDDRLDATFAALADPTRRNVLTALQAGSRCLSELAADADMSLPGFMKHLRALQQAVTICIGLYDRHYVRLG